MIPHFPEWGVGCGGVCGKNTVVQVSILVLFHCFKMSLCTFSFTETLLAIQGFLQMPLLPRSLF